MSEWQPIETASKVENGHVILVSVPARMGPYVCLAIWWSDGGWHEASEYRQIEPSHWIDIPPHPMTGEAK